MKYASNMHSDGEFGRLSNIRNTTLSMTSFSNLIRRTFFLVVTALFLTGIVRAQLIPPPNITIGNSGTAAFDKPALIFDRGSNQPKGRLTFQRSGEDGGWSGLVLGINADWNSTPGAGYLRDMKGRSQSFLQMEYEYDTGDGYKVNEINWTTNGRRLFNFAGKAGGFPDVAALNLMAPVLINVPQSDASSYGQPDPTGQWDPNNDHGIGSNSLAALAVYSYQGGGNSTQILIQNNNYDSPAASAQVWLRGIGSGGYPSSTSTSWAIGVDRFWTGTNNFYIYDEKRRAEALFIDQAGRVGIGTTLPAKALDVNGSIAIGHGAATWTQGSAAPTANEPDGSLYSRVNAGPASGLYVRENGAWIKK